MAANDSKSYLPYLNKLVGQYNNTYHHSIRNKLLMLITLFWLKKLKRIVKFLNLKSVIESESQRIRVFSRETFVIDYALKTNPWTYKIKDLNREKTMGNFHEK